MMVRVIERPTDDGLVEVSADGPDALRGRHLFSARAEAAQFRQFLERQLTAAGFAGVGGTMSDWREAGKEIAISPEASSRNGR